MPIVALTVQAAPSPAPVAGVGGTNSAELRGIKGPVHIPNSYAWVGWVLGGILLAVALWKLWQHFRKRREAPKPAIVIPAHRKAKDRLRNAAELMSDPYQFCSLVSNVLRVYIEDRFELHAPKRTTEEFLLELSRTTMLHVDHKRLLEAFLTQCDLVKFARHEPTQPELQSLLDSALRFIDETSATPEAAPAAPPTLPQPAALNTTA